VLGVFIEYFATQQTKYTSTHPRNQEVF